MRPSKYFSTSNLVYALLLSASQASAQFKVPGIPSWLGFINPGAGGKLPPPSGLGSSEPTSIPFNPTPPRLPGAPVIEDYCGLEMPATLESDDQVPERRRSRIYYSLKKRETVEIVDNNSTNPLHDAFKNLVPADLLDALLQSVTAVSLNRLPASQRYTWVNGLSGVFTVPSRGKYKTRGFQVGNREIKQTYYAGEEVVWEVRWDNAVNETDSSKDKGPHVNADFSAKKSKKRVKFDIRLKPTKYSYRYSPDPRGDASPVSDGGHAGESFAAALRREGTQFMEGLRRSINLSVGYTGQFAQNGEYDGLMDNPGLSAAETATRDEFLNGLRDRLLAEWRPIVNGTCSDDNPLY
ncbi:MAG: hypothetical protein M1836_006858 [Candelina mexicana]|nr:MAG: hypothetical protein M1836_006858 [Candelina mexicana]